MLNRVLLLFSVLATGVGTNVLAFAGELSLRQKVACVVLNAVGSALAVAFQLQPKKDPS
jgi:hypothetical protein